MSLPKKAILKPLRLTLLSMALLAFAGLVYGFIATYQAVYVKPATIDKPIATYNYNHKGQIDYRVQFKPNNIFKEITFQPGKNYFGRLVDYINLNYSYVFNADQETVLEGTYTITATLDAKDMWQKDFVLVPPTSFNGKGKSFSINKNYALNTTPFKDYLKKVNQELGVPASDTKLNVKVSIDLKGDAQAGSWSDSLVPNLVIPITEGQFKIDGNLTNEKGDSISLTETVTDPALGQKKTRLIFLTISIIVVGSLLAFLLLWTRGKPVPPMDEELLIQKKYGTRLVKVAGGIQLGDDVMVISFNTIEELVKVADELGKPIINAHSAITGITYYFVFDGQVVYKYLLGRGTRPIQYKRTDFPVSI